MILSLSIALLWCDGDVGNCKTALSMLWIKGADDECLILTGAGSEAGLEFVCWLWISLTCYDTARLRYGSCMLLMRPIANFRDILWLNAYHDKFENRTIGKWVALGGTSDASADLCVGVNFAEPEPEPCSNNNHGRNRDECQRARYNAWQSPIFICNLGHSRFWLNFVPGCK